MVEIPFRFLRIWEHGKGGKIAKHKIYLKSRLNCVLMTRCAFLPLELYRLKSILLRKKLFSR